MSRGWLLPLLLLGASCYATELRPWFPETFQPEVRGSYLFDTYPAPFGGETLNSGIGSVLLSPWPTWCGEVEAAVTHSDRNGTFFDYGRVTLRYLVLDDVVGDPVSWTVGGTLTLPSTSSIRDIGTPHLGSVELELHSAVGRERCCGNTWSWRYWALGAITTSFQDWPRLSGRLVVERNVCDRHRFEAALLGLVGLAGNPLPPPNRFPGYAKIQTRALDVQIGYEYLTRFCGSLKLAYAYRLAAKNYPRRNHAVTLTLFYPISP